MKKIENLMKSWKQAKKFHICCSVAGEHVQEKTQQYDVIISLCDYGVHKKKVQLISALEALRICTTKVNFPFLCF